MPPVTRPGSSFFRDFYRDRPRRHAQKRRQGLPHHGCRYAEASVRHRPSGLEQIGGHAAAHVAKSDKSNLHDLQLLNAKA